MLSKLLCIGLLLAAQGALGDLKLPKFKDKDIASGKALAELNRLALEGAGKQYNTKCNKKNVKVRKEW